jgi:hypothetical protein
MSGKTTHPLAFGQRPAVGPSPVHGGRDGVLDEARSIGFSRMVEPATHHCLPRAAERCLVCGEDCPRPTFCERCGEDVTPPHVCQPHPLPHHCPPAPSPGQCLQCRLPLPKPVFCTTCGADITPGHRCRAAPPTHVHRADPVHICPSTSTLPRCPDCGLLLPPKAFCAHCGMETTPPHVCAAPPPTHVCPPLVTMPRRCSHCGELMPARRFCPLCGADLTPEHVCQRS